MYIYIYIIRLSVAIAAVLSFVFFHAYRRLFCMYDHSREMSTYMSDFKVHNWIVLVSFLEYYIIEGLQFNNYIMLVSKMTWNHHGEIRLFLGNICVFFFEVLSIYYFFLPDILGNSSYC